MKAMQKVTPEDGAIPRPGWKKPENLQKLIEIVQKYPSTESALTARLLIMHIYLDPDNHSKDLPKGRNLLSKIKEDFLKTWQSTIAEMIEVSLLLMQKQWEAALQSAERIYDRVGHIEERQNEEYIQYKKFIQNGSIYDIRADILNTLVYTYCKIGDLEKAKVTCERLVKDHPDYPRIETAKHDLKELQKGVSPYFMPPKKTKE